MEMPSTVKIDHFGKVSENEEKRDYGTGERR
jgi:hypothetical protein